MKAEVVRLDGREPRDNARFVVTNLRHKPENVYLLYRGRGDSENREPICSEPGKSLRPESTADLANRIRRNDRRLCLRRNRLKNIKAAFGK